MWSVTLVHVVVLLFLLCVMIHSKPISSEQALPFHELALHQLIPQTALFSGLRKLRVKLTEEEPVGREVANLKFLTSATGQQQKQAPSDTGADASKTRADNFQIFNSDPQSKFFHLESHTGILRIARRIDRDQLCPRFRSCCAGPRPDLIPPPVPTAAFDGAQIDELMMAGTSYADPKDPGAQLPECRLDLNVRSDDQYSKIILIHVHIVDINDNAPVWPQFSTLSDSFMAKESAANPRVMVVTLSENSLIGDSVSLTPAFDADLGSNGIVRYTLSPILPEFALHWQAELEFTGRPDSMYTGGSDSNGLGTVNHAQQQEPEGKRQRKQPFREQQENHQEQQPIAYLESDLVTSQRHELRLVVNKPLDRESQAVYDFTLTAYDGGSPVRNASVPLCVLITDANDNSPKFQKDTYVVELRENARPHTPVIQVVATDVDEGVNSRIKYRFSSLTKPEFVRLFSLDSVTGWIHVQWEIDYELHKKIILTVEAVDGGNLPRASTCIVEILVQDENDHSPEIRFEPAHLTNYALVPENETPGRLVAVFTATDQDSGENGRVSCQLTDPAKWRFETADQARLDTVLTNPLQSLFKLQQMHVPFSVMYKLTTASMFDRELTSRILVWITCSDFGQPARNTSGSVSVRITDVNDERPRFARSSYYHSVREDVAIDFPIFTINATDNDEGENSQLTYWLTGPDADYFQVNEKTGQLSVRRALDRESRDLLTFHLHTTDHGTPALNATVEVIVAVTDVNDNAPEIPDHMEFTVLENHTAAVPIGKILVNDKDIGKNAEVSFSLIQCFAHLPTSEESGTLSSERGYSTGTNFSAVKTNDMLYTFFIAKDGRIYLGHAKLDREKYPMYELMVRVEDHGIPRLSSTAVVKINILDVNDNAPRFIFPSSSNNTVYVARASRPGSLIAQIYAIDDDLYDNGKVTYELQADRRSARSNDLFELDSQSGLLRLRRAIGSSAESQTTGWHDESARNSTWTRTTTTATSSHNQTETNEEHLAGLTDLHVTPAAYSLFINAYDGGNPRLKTSTILRILLTPPFYPPMRSELTNWDGSTDLLESVISSQRNTNGTWHGVRGGGGGRGLGKSKWLHSGGGLVHGEDDLTGIGILLGLVVAIGLFVCFVLLIVTILLRQAHQLRQRRDRRPVQVPGTPKHPHGPTAPPPAPMSTVVKLMPTPTVSTPLELPTVGTQLYTPYIGTYQNDPQAFYTIRQMDWGDSILIDTSSI